MSDRFESAIDDFVAEIGGAAWFAACGEPMTDGERNEAASYAAGLGFPDVPVTSAPDWRAAATVTQRSDWSRAWWEREAAEEARLKAVASAALGEERLLEGLSRVALASSALAGAAALGLARGGVADEALQRVAAGAAAQACHQAGLARAAEQSPDHVFAVKFRLFAAGRWPLGVVGERFFVL